jgi:hypothetical protein
VAVQVEADDRRRGVGVDAKLIDVERIDGDLVVVGLAFRRAGAAIADRAEVVAHLQGAGRHSWATSRSLRQ